MQRSVIENDVVMVFDELGNAYKAIAYISTPNCGAGMTSNRPLTTLRDPGSHEPRQDL